MNVTLFVILRTAHVLFAALWLGAGALLALVILPAIGSAGEPGGRFAAEAVRRGLPKFMASVAGLTILTGILTFWQWAESVGKTGMHSAGGILLMLGALAGVAAISIGGAVLAPGIKQLAALATENTDAGSRQARIAVVQRRMATAARIALALLVTALVLMSVSRFV